MIPVLLHIENVACFTVAGVNLQKITEVDVI